MNADRRGFTILEVLIAVILVDVGLLALVGASAVLVRSSAELRARSAALHAAENRLQLLGASACVATSGAAAGGGPAALREQWSVQPRNNGVRDISDSVSFAVGTATKIIVLRTRLPC